MKGVFSKGAWEPFVSAVEEYFELSHAEEIPQEDLSKSASQVFYVPMHGIVKSESTTTKLRIVFDASEIPEWCITIKGPTIFPHITDVL